MLLVMCVMYKGTHYSATEMPYTRKFADIIVLEGGQNLVALDLIMQRIANHIAEN